MPKFIRLPEDGLLRQAEKCWRANQLLNNIVQHVGINPLCK